MKVKEEEIKGEMFALLTDLSDYNMWIRTNGHGEHTEVIRYENRSNGKRSRNLRSKTEEILK